LRNCYSTLIGG